MVVWSKPYLTKAAVLFALYLGSGLSLDGLVVLVLAPVLTLRPVLTHGMKTVYEEWGGQLTLRCEGLFILCIRRMEG